MKSIACLVAYITLGLLSSQPSFAHQTGIFTTTCVIDKVHTRNPQPVDYQIAGFYQNTGNLPIRLSSQLCEDHSDRNCCVTALSACYGLSRFVKRDLTLAQITTRTLNMARLMSENSTQRYWDAPSDQRTVKLRHLTCTPNPDSQPNPDPSLYGQPLPPDQVQPYLTPSIQVPKPREIPQYTPSNPIDVLDYIKTYWELFPVELQDALLLTLFFCGGAALIIGFFSLGTGTASVSFATILLLIGILSDYDLVTSADNTQGYLQSEQHLEINQQGNAFWASSSDGPAVTIHQEDLASLRQAIQQKNKQAIQTLVYKIQKYNKLTTNEGPSIAE